MKAYRVRQKDIEIGNAVPWDILDQNGMLLMKRGAIVTSKRQQAALAERGLYLDQSGALTNGKATADDQDQKVKAKAAFNPFDIIENCTFRLGRILFALTQGKDVTDKLNVIVDALIATCARDPDAALGAVHLLHGHAYTTIHPIHTAALCYALCSATKTPPDEIRSIIGACLVSNIGMLELQEVLHEQNSPLTDDQREEINSHPEVSVKILQACGVKDPLLLKIVLQHHERTDGKGYPKRLQGEQICRGAKIVALSDFYSAIISPRSYKDTKQASAALKTLFIERGKEYDETLAVLLIKHMGVYPPGCFVELKNGEIAVVVRRTPNNMAPAVASVANLIQGPYTRPIKRDTNKPETAVVKMVENKYRLTLDLSTIWGYNT